jgi:hypothetical protein
LIPMQRFVIALKGQNTIAQGAALGLVHLI